MAPSMAKLASRSTNQMVIGYTDTHKCLLAFVFCRHTF